MIKFIKEHKLAVTFFGLICTLYFLLRLPHLTLQPIFADEAIYIRWAQIMKAEPTLRFVSMSDGKPPLFMWMMSPLFKIFTDPLLAGRFLSTLSGFLTLLGALFLGWKFFNLSVGLWSALLITITPFIVFFDRMALVDSLLAAFSIWSLNLSLLLIKYQRLDLAMFLGYSLGGGLLTKPPGFFDVLVVPTTLMIFKWKDQLRQKKILKLFGLWIVAIGIAVVIYNILRLGPGFVTINSRNQDYVFSPLDLVGRPLDPFLPHLKDLKDWLPKLLTVPILVSIFAGIFLAIKKLNRTILAILLWSLVPMAIEMALLKTFTARYILFSIPPLLVVAGWAISQIPSKLLTLALILPLSLYFDMRLLENPAKAPLPREERRGYLEDWTAGYGFKQIAGYLMDQAKSDLVVVGTEGSFGTLPDGLQIYLDKYSHTADKNHQVVVVGGKATISAQLKEASLEHPTFFVANESRFPRFTENLKLIQEFPKAIGPKLPPDSILFFKVLPAK